RGGLRGHQYLDLARPTRGDGPGAVQRHGPLAGHRRRGGGAGRLRLAGARDPEIDLGRLQLLAPWHPPLPHSSPPPRPPARPLFPFLAAACVVPPALALGIPLGRIGCFLNGCCYGDVCHLPWAVRFPAHSPPWSDEVDLGRISPVDAWSLPLHPTQLYSFLD